MTDSSGKGTSGANRHITLGIVAAIVGIVIGVLLFRRHTPPDHSNTSDAVRRITLSDSPSAASRPQNRTSSDVQTVSEPKPMDSFLVVLQNEKRSIAARLPDLKTVKVTDALSSLWPKRMRYLKRDSTGRVLTDAWEEPTRPEQYTIPKSIAGEDGFRMLGRLMTSELLNPSLDKGAPLVENLLQLITAGDDFLGSDDESRMVTSALRWYAALGLRGLEADAESISRLKTTASAHQDEVLRGALVGSLIAHKPSDPFVSSWLAAETSDRARQAFLYELIRRNRYVNFSEDARLHIEESDGQVAKILYSHKDAKEEERPLSGQSMGVELLQLLQNSTANGQTKDLCLEALELRMEASLLPMVSIALYQEADLTLKTKMLKLYAGQSVPEGESYLIALGMDKRIDPSFRASAVSSLSRYGGDRSRAAWQQLLWDEAKEPRLVSAVHLLTTGDSPPSTALERIQWMSENDPDAGVRQTLKAILRQGR